ncbi:MAG: DUF4160 domain-containing protein [Candidatus Limnocylindria bacterium]
MPTVGPCRLVLRAGPYRFFFWSNERSEPPHVHAAFSRPTCLTSIRERASRLPRASSAGSARMRHGGARLRAADVWYRGWHAEDDGLSGW